MMDWYKGVHMPSYSIGGSNTGMIHELEDRFDLSAVDV